VAEGAATSDRLRLAFLGDSGSIHFSRWVNFMAERGHEVTVLLAEGTRPGPGLHETIALEWFRSYARRGFGPLALVAARRSLRRVLGRVRPDVLNAHYMTVHGTNAWLSGFHPYAVTLWGSDILVSPRRSRRLAILARLGLRSADLVMVNSEALRQAALVMGAPEARLEVVQWGVDLTRFAPGPDPATLRTRLGLERRRVVFSPRMIAPLYRPLVIVEAFATLPGDCALLMSLYGADPRELELVRQRVEELGLRERVVMVPEIAYADMPDYYRLAEAVVSVPASDSTAVTILESMATGLPIVAADLPSMREWLADVEPALLVPVDDPTATAAALARALAASGSERAALASRARSAVEARADQAESLGRVEALYRQLASRNRARGAGRAPS
jgi:glycosyltransferase involved in cell wall biosynthesis